MSFISTLRSVCPSSVWSLAGRCKASLRHQADRLILGNATARNTWFAAADIWDSVTGKSEPLTPPRRLQFAIGGSFREMGEATFRQLCEWTELRPTETVLEVGCGCGRVAVHLAGYPEPPGAYHGFDVMKDCVGWCQRAVTPRHPHCHFAHADIHNRWYNPGGKFQGAEFVFPHADGSMDVVFLTSVFTHLLPEECEHYLAEIARVLRPGGRCLATFFLMNPESVGLMRRSDGLFPFQEQAGYWTTNPATPELAVGLEEDWLRDRLDARGLSITRVERGGWCGREGVPPSQDVALITRRTG